MDGQETKWRRIKFNSMLSLECHADAYLLSQWQRCLSHSLPDLQNRTKHMSEIVCIAQHFLPKEWAI
jgi:hypothetical protein